MKKLFGKRGIALLTTLALVVSMVAMLGGLTANAEYSPKRAVTFTSEGIQQSCMMLEDAYKVAAGETVTVAGYYKVDSITTQTAGGHFGGFGVKTTEPTDGWVAFSYEYAVPTGGHWQSLGFWEADGTFSLADITFTKADGTVVYDFATDAELIPGTVEYNAGNKYVKQSLWYVMGAYGTVAEGGKATVVMDDVYVAPIEVKRAVTFTATGIQQSCMMLEDAYKVAAGEKVTVAGYYRVDSLTQQTTGGHFGIFDIKVTEPTNGWVAFSTEYDVPTGGQWKSFGFWEADGTFALADITFTNAKGEVVYDFATDAELIPGTVEYNAGNKYVKQSLWYVMGAYGTVAEGGKATVVMGDVYTPPYIPRRAVTFTVSEGIQQSCLMLEDAFKVAAGEKVTVSGYYKVDSISGGSFEVLGGAIKVTEATDGWVEFSVEYDVPTGAQWKHFGFWQASGEFAVADIQFTNANGQVVYDFASDEALVAGTYEYSKAKGYDKLSLFYLMGAYGTVAEGAKCTVVVDEADVAPEYKPVRVLSYTAGGTQVNGKILVTGSGTKLGEGKEVVVKGYYKVENFKALNKADNERIIIAGNIDVTEDCAWTPFEVAYTTGDSNWLGFEYWYAQGTISIADITIEDKDGKVIYDLISDEALVAGEYTADTWVLSQGMWYFGYYQEKSEISYTIGECIPVEDPCANGHTYIGGVCKFCGAEKEYPTIEGDPNYVPDRVMSIETFGGKNGAAGAAIEGKFLLTRGYFPGHSVVVIKGYYKIDNYREAASGADFNVQIGAGGGCNPADSYAAKGSTNGWVPFSVKFLPKAQDNTEWDGCAKFGHWYTHGKLSMADVTVESLSGEVLYDMRYDETLPTGTTAGGTEFLTEETKGIQTDRWYIGAYGFDDWSDIEVVVTPALEKPVTPPAQTGDVNMIVVVALGAMAAMTLAVVTLNKKKFSV